MEHSHAYTVEEAQNLLVALQQGEAFLERVSTDDRQKRRSDPWQHYRNAGETAFYTHREAVSKAGDELKMDPRRLLGFAKESLFEELYDKGGTPTPETSVEQLLVHGASALDALIGDISTDPETFLSAGKDLLLGLVRDLAKGPLYLSKHILEGLVKNPVKADSLRNLRRNVWYHGDYSLAHSFEGIVGGPLAPLIENFKKEMYKRRVGLANAVKERELAPIPKPSEDAIKRENFRLTGEEVKTLHAVLGQCRDFFIKRYEIADQHKQYVDISDLTVEDFKLALAAAPKALQSVAFKALLALQRKQLLGVLLYNSRIEEFNMDGAKRQYPLIDEHVPHALRSVNAVRELYPSAASRPQREDTTGRRKDLYISGSLSIEKDEDRVPTMGTFFYGSKLSVNGLSEKPLEQMKWVGCRGKIEGITIKNSNLLGFDGKLDNCSLKGSEIRNPTGLATGSVYENCTIEAGEGFTAEAGMMMHCVLRVRAGARFHGLALYETKVELMGGETEGSPIFEVCDFSELKLKEAELLELARASTRCEFSPDQLKILNQSKVECGAVSAVERTKQIDRILATEDGTPLEIKDWTVLNQNAGEKHMEVDMLDSARRQLKGVPISPVLSEAGLDKGYDPRLLARPLNRESIGELPERVAAYKLLAIFVGQHRKAERVDLKTWFEFFKSLGVKTASSCFGIPPMLLEFEPSYLQSLPDRAPIGMEYATSGGSAVGQVQYYFEDEQDLERLSGKIYSNRDSRTGYQRDIRLSRFTKHQWLKQKFEQYLLNLHRFGLYLEGLTKMGYVYPELDETASGFELEGLVHPDVHKKLGEIAQENDISLPAAEGGSVVSISSAQNNDGKSTLQAAIALALSQAQSGLPVPARRARLNPNAAFDSIMVMPNTRADAGQGDGVMKERVQTYAELRARLTTKTGEGSRVLVLMDEISMGATNARQAATFDTNTVLEVSQGIPGVRATVIAIVQDAEEIVPRWQAALGAENVVLLTHTNDQAPHQFTRGEKAVSSKPDAVLKEFGLSHLMSDSGWRTT